MEKDSSGFYNSQLVNLFFVAIIIGFISCGYTPSVDKVNKMMIQEENKFDYLLSVAKRLESRYNYCEFHLLVDYYSYRSQFSLIDDNQETTIKYLLYFELDDIGKKDLEKSDSFQKYISADLLPMFDSVIQIRKDLNCRSISISNSNIIIEYIGDVCMYVINNNYLDTPIVLPTFCNDGIGIDILIENEKAKQLPYGNRLKKDSWYYTVSRACHGIE